MEPLELSPPQARALARISANQPLAKVIVHPTAHGPVVEVRRGRQIALARLDEQGRIERDRPLGRSRRKRPRAQPSLGPLPDAA